MSLSFRGANATSKLLVAGAGRKQVPPLRFAHHRNDKEFNVHRNDNVQNGH